MTTNLENQVKLSLLDVAYQKLSGNTFKAERGVVSWRERAWADFVRAGFTLHDLEAVILHLKQKILVGKRYRECLGFRRLICNLDVFEDELSQAQGEARNAEKPRSDKERVLAATGRVVTPTPSQEKRAKEVIEKLLSDMRKAAQ